MNHMHLAAAKLSVLLGLALMASGASAEMTAAAASQALQDANHIATSFQSPTTSINTNNYGYRYAQLWTAQPPNTLHSGTDINTTNDCGRRVAAVGNGVVRFKGHGGTSWGGVILIQHRFWDESARSYAEVTSQYAHVAPLDSLAEGTLVTAGQHIGYIADQAKGSCNAFEGVANPSAFNVTWSPHLHFEIRTATALTATRWSTAQNFQAASACANILSATSACRIAAVNAVGYSDPEAWIAAHANVVPPTPAPPVGLNVKSASVQGISLAWTDNSNNETGFKVERKTGASGAWNRMATVAANLTTYTTPAATAGLSYFFRVRSTNGVNDSAPSNEVAVTVGELAPPSAPKGLSATATGTSSINLAWTDTSSNETAFRIEQRRGTGSWSVVASLAANVTTFAATGLAAATQYSYRVAAVNAAGASASSNEAAAVTQAVAPKPPAAPGPLTVVSVSRSTISLAWTDNSTNETGFVVERRLGLGAWSPIAGLSANTRTFSDGGVAPGRAYGYRVYATSAAGNSSYSPVVDASTPR